MKMIKHKAPPLLQLKTKHAKFSNRIRNKYESKVDLYLGTLSLVFREGVANEDTQHTYAFQSLFHSFFIKKFFTGTVSPTLELKNNQYPSLFRTTNFENKPDRLRNESNLLSQINKAIMFTKLLSIQSSNEYFSGYQAKAPFPRKKGTAKQAPAYAEKSKLFPLKWFNQLTHIENVQKQANVLNHGSNYYRITPLIATELMFIKTGMKAFKWAKSSPKTTLESYYLHEQRSFSLAHWQPSKIVSEQQFLLRKGKDAIASFQKATERGRLGSKLQPHVKERFFTLIEHELEHSWNNLFSANVLTKKWLQKEQLKAFNSRLSKTFQFTIEHWHREDNDATSAKPIVIDNDLFNWNFNIYDVFNVQKSGKGSEKRTISIEDHVHKQHLFTLAYLQPRVLERLFSAIAGRSFSVAHWQPSKLISEQQFLLRQGKEAIAPLQKASERGRPSSKLQPHVKERFITLIEHELERSRNNLFSANVLTKKWLQKEQLKAFNSRLSKTFQFTIEQWHRKDNDATFAKPIVIDNDLFNWNFNIYDVFNVQKSGKGSEKRTISSKNHVHEQRLFSLVYLQPRVLERLFSAIAGRSFSVAHWQPPQMISERQFLLRKGKEAIAPLQKASERGKQRSNLQPHVKERFITLIEHELEHSWNNLFSANVLTKKWLQKEQLKAFNSMFSKTLQFAIEHWHKEDNDATSAKSIFIENNDLVNWNLNVKHRNLNLARAFLYAKDLAKTKFLFNNYRNGAQLLQSINSQLILSHSGMKHVEQLREVLETIQLDLERKKQQGEAKQLIKKKIKKRYFPYSEQGMKRERSRMFQKNLFAKTLLQQQNGEFHFRLQQTLGITPERKHDKDSDAKTSKPIAVERFLSVQNSNVKEVRFSVIKPFLRTKDVEKTRSVLDLLRKHSLFPIVHWQPPPFHPNIITEKQFLKLTSALSNNKAKRFLHTEPRLMQHLLKNDELQTFINEDIFHVATSLLEKQVTYLLKKVPQQMNLLTGTKDDKLNAGRRISTTTDEQQRFQLHKQTFINNVETAQLNRVKLDRKLVGDHLLNLAKYIHLPYFALKLPIERIKHRQFERTLPFVTLFSPIKEPFNEDALYKRMSDGNVDSERFVVMNNVSSEQFFKDNAYVRHLVKNNTKLGQRIDEKAANVLTNPTSKSIFLRSTTERTRTASESLLKKRLKSYAEINKHIARLVKNITRQHQLTNSNLMMKESRFTHDFSAVSLQFRKQSQALNDSFQRPLEMSHYKPTNEKHEAAKIQKIVKQMIDNEQKKLKNEEKQTSSFLEININQVVEQIYVKLNRKLNFEQQRRGL